PSRSMPCVGVSHGPVITKERRAPPSLRHLFFYLVMAATTFLVCIAMTTVFGLFLDRMDGVHTMAREHSYDPRLGWTAKPGYHSDQVLHPNFPFKLSLRINSAGFRDYEWSKRTQDNSSRRVLVIGDSYIYGYASYTNDTFTRVSEELAGLVGRNTK